MAILKNQEMHEAEYQVCIYLNHPEDSIEGIVKGIDALFSLCEEGAVLTTDGKVYRKKDFYPVDKYKKIKAYAPPKSIAHIYIKDVIEPTSETE